MKYALPIFCIIVISLISAPAATQPCIFNYKSLRNQIDIDRFFDETKECPSVYGDIFIQEDTPGMILDLSGLRNLQTLHGDLTIRGNEALASLHGVGSLDTVFGDILIDFNPSLDTIDGFDELRFVSRNLSIGSENNLNYLGEFPLLDSVRNLNVSLGDITIMNSFPAVRHLNKLGIGGTNLEELHGFNALQTVHELQLRSLHAIAKLEGLAGISSLHILSISNCDAPIDFEDFTSLEAISGGIDLAYNANLNSLDWLNTVSLDGIENVRITNNPSLASCQLDWLCEVLQDPGIDVEIQDNGPGCQSLMGTLGACNILCPANLILRTQAEVDAFPQMFPGCHQLAGSLEIVDRDSSITNLDSLVSLQYIEGDLILHFCPGLQQIEGLRGIQAVGGDITVNNVHALTTLEGLHNIQFADDIAVDAGPLIQKVSGLRGLKRCDSLTISNFIGVEGLNSLEKVSGQFFIYTSGWIESFEFPTFLDTIMGPIHIQGPFGDILGPMPSLRYVGGIVIDRTQLRSLSSLAEVDEVRGDIIMQRNEKLASLIGFEDIPIVEGDIVIEENDSLADLALLRNRTTFNHTLSLSDNDALPNLSDLSGIEILGGLSLGQNDLIANLNGLESLRRVNGNLTVYGQHLITDMAELSNLEQVGGSLHVGNNSQQLSLHGLESLDSVGNVLQIDAYKLTTLSALHNLKYVGDTLRLWGSAFNSLHGLDELAETGTIDLQFLYDLGNMDALADVVLRSGGIIIKYCPKLTHLPEFTSIDTISGDLELDEVDQLADISGLSHVKFIKGAMRLHECADLSSLHGLENLMTIEGEFEIENTALITFDELLALETIGKSVSPQDFDVTIRNNYFLSACGIHPICELLNGHRASITIMQNDAGCNNTEEVTELCSLIDVIPDHVFELQVYPNPATDKIFISSNSPMASGTSISMFDHLGHLVFQGGFEPMILVSHLATGIYTMLLQQPGEKPEVARLALLR